MSVFSNKAVFERVDEPFPVGREWKIKQAVSEFQDSPLNVTPATAVIYGHPKSGKSAVLRATCTYLEKLAEEQGDYDIEIVNIDCKSLDDRRELFFEILQKQENEKSQNINPEKRKYTTFTWLKDQIKNHIVDRDADFYVFALDDIDRIEESTEALENLIVNNNEYGKPNVGFLATSTKRRLIENSHLLSRQYLTTEIHLNFPGEDEYRRALEANVEAALKDNSITDGAFQRLFEWCHEAAQIGEAVEILVRAGERADEQKSNQIMEQHIEQAIEDFNMLFGIEWLLDRNFDVHNQAILLALANHDNQATRTKQLYEKYESILKDTNSDTLSYRRFRDRILEEELLSPFTSIVKYNKGSQGGVYFKIQLKDDPEMIYTALNHESYRELPKSHLPDIDSTQFRNLPIKKWKLRPEHS